MTYKEGHNMSKDGTPPQGTPMRRIRIGDDLWRRAGDAARADPEGNRSVIIRQFLRWYVGDTDELPWRPAPRR